MVTVCQAVAGNMLFRALKKSLGQNELCAPSFRIHLPLRKKLVGIQYVSDDFESNLLVR